MATAAGGGAGRNGFQGVGVVAAEAEATVPTEGRADPLDQH
jgi:hypothetical protein